MADVQHNTTGAASTAAEIVSAIPIPQGPSVPHTSDGDRQAHAEVGASPDGHPTTTNETLETPLAPAPSSTKEVPASPVGSRSDAQTTATGDSSFNEKHHSKEGEENVKGTKKDKKAKKEPKDKRTPFEIAMENPELANLREDHRRAIAEQM